jgi:hypothetical protein
MKNENALKKHHFWILLGIVPLFTLIAVLTVSSNVGGKIEERAKAIKEATSAIDGKKNPKPVSLINEALVSLKKVEKRQGGLHKENWDAQRYLFTWPGNSKLLQRFDQMDLKFGAPLPTDQGEFDEFRKPEVYLREFSSLLRKDAVGPGTGMADKVAPTQFNNGDWRSVLRHVNDWGQSQITKDEVWLVMEDIWVQRSLLDAVRSVNAEMATFRRAKRDADGNVVVDPSFNEAGSKLDADGKPTATPDPEKLKALFRSRTWGVELKVVKEGTAYKLVGTLSNLTERLQLLGNNNTLALNVWFAKAPQPLLFQIGGEYLAGKGAKKLVKLDGKEVEEAADAIAAVPLPSHTLAAGVEPTEIVRVEQVFDTRTVPVKQINALVLGKLDSRYAGQQLVAPKFFPPDPDAAGAADAKGPGGPPGGPPGSTGGPPGVPMGATGPPAGPPTGPGAGFGGGLPAGPQAVPGKPFGGGSILEIADGNKKRYLAATGEVRRMPVGLVLVVDQSFLQDVLLAFANSPLRFQITQVTWKRFSGTLVGATSSGTSAGPGGDIAFGSGSSNVRGSGDPDAVMSPSMGVSKVRPTMPGSGAPGGPGPVRTGPGGAGPGSVGPASSAGGPNGSSVSEAQITAGLIELSVYGVISLYEKFETAKAPDAPTPVATGPGSGPPGTPPAPGAPPPGGPPAPGPTNPPPKKRRRIQAR